MNTLKSYDKNLEVLLSTDIIITVDNLEPHDLIINHRSEEFKTNGHVHCETIEEGIKILIEIYLERLIWKMEENTK